MGIRQVKHASDPHPQSSQAKMHGGYIKHGKYDQISTKLSLSMAKHDLKLHKAEPKHASMMVQRQYAFLSKIEEYKASVLCMQGVKKPTWDRGKTC